mmetsp:Transcript_8575/g.14758  ORF Transcript_8575/g.14758 Transcript_8575/m.14758 type:complete len:210 (-) Transcript_8575:23-652(-)
MSYQDHRLALGDQQVLDAIVEDVLASVLVHGRQRIVQHLHLRLRVDGAGQGDALALAAAQIDAALADLRLVAVREDLHVALQRAREHHLTILGIVKGPTEKNVVADSAVLDPRRLGHVGDRTADRQAALEHLTLGQNRHEKRRLATADRPYKGHHLALGKVQGDVVDDRRRCAVRQRAVFHRDADDAAVLKRLDLVTEEEPLDADQGRY